MTNTFTNKQQIKFRLPYLDGNLKFHGEIITVKTKSLLVEYKTSIGENKYNKVKTLVAEIPYNFVFGD